MLKTKQSLYRTVGPTIEPVTLAEARDQCEIISTDTTHDTKLTRYLAASREQIENDTGYSCLLQTYTLSLDEFPDGDVIDIPIRPVQSITSIYYQDDADSSTLLATSVYGLDQARRMIYLKYNQSWPSVAVQHNGVIVTLVAGFGATASTVPYLIKQAILLQLTKWFAHRGDEAKVMSHDTAYENIIKRILRSSYP